MNNNSQIEPRNTEKIKMVAMLKSALLILTLTMVFGLLSYLLIQVNNAVFQLSISESLWCGLAMALVTAYYLLQRNERTQHSADDEVI